MLRDPLAVKKFLLTPFWSKNNLQNPKKTPLEPLDLLATVGQSCVCVSVSVLVSVCVCGEERRCGVVTLESPKKRISLFPYIILSVSNKQTISVSLSITYITTKLTVLLHLFHE